jgi:signal transduction histidine kinase
MLQMLFTFIAALSVATLSILLITEVVRGAERVVLGEAHKAISTAIAELKQQYEYRASSDTSWPNLPAQARNVSLRGITQTVLLSYPGVEGGFYSGSDFLGYAFPTHDTGSEKIDVPSAERGLIVSLTQQSRLAHRMIQQVIRGRTDLLVLGAEPSPNGSTIVWAMKRLAGRAAPGIAERGFLLSALGLAALISIAGTLATGLGLARGVAQIKSGLSRLEQDFEFHLPERADELGAISRSINQMASTRRKLETELRREDRLRALGRLAAGLAHEIRNPLNSIRLTVQLLDHRLKTNSIRPEDFRTVQAEVDRLSALLNDLLDLQRLRQPRPEQQPVLPVVQHCIGLVQRHAEMQNTKVLLENGNVDLRAFFDSQQLTQTIVNLLLNALQASPPGKTIYVRASQENGLSHIEVEDEGPGLDPEQREHLFEPFYTTKPAGTGLGLAVSRELIRSAGGDLIYAATEAGARFLVELPRN